MSTIDSGDIAWRSHWLQQALAGEHGLEPPLEGDTSADVAIIGGGFLGLWTALRLKEAEPSLDVLLIERDICGGGPSGRNSYPMLGRDVRLRLTVVIPGVPPACQKRTSLVLANLRRSGSRRLARCG